MRTISSEKLVLPHFSKSIAVAPDRLSGLELIVSLASKRFTGLIAIHQGQDLILGGKPVTEIEASLGRVYLRVSVQHP